MEYLDWGLGFRGANERFFCNIYCSGHPRKNWQPLPLAEPERPEKGAFIVRVNGNVRDQG